MLDQVRRTSDVIEKGTTLMAGEKERSSIPLATVSHSVRLLSLHPVEAPNLAPEQLPLSRSIGLEFVVKAGSIRFPEVALPSFGATKGS